MARLHQFKKINKTLTINPDDTYIIMDNNEWDAERILTIKEVLNYIKKNLEEKKSNIKNINFYKFPNNLTVPPSQCEPIEPLNIAYDNKDIYFWIDNKWKKSSLLDR